jgi:FkbM family methyltransferase
MAGSMINLVQLPVYFIKRLPSENLFWLHKYHGILKRLKTNIETKTYFGASMECSINDFIGKKIILYGRWEPNISHVIESLLHPGDVVADVGANIGYDTLLAAKMVGSSGSVIAIEASPSTFSKLNRNVQINNLGNVRTVNAAVLGHRGEIEIYITDKDNIGASTTVKVDGSEYEATVACDVLDAFLNPEELKRLSLIKIDVEGAEISIILDIISKIDSYPVSVKILVEAALETKNFESWRSILNDLQRLGFLAYAIENAYEEAWYLAWRKPKLPVLMEHMPSEKTDILFSRKPLAFS